MIIPERVSNAACVVPGDMPTARARRVILALASDLPESAVEKALDEYGGAEHAYWPAAMRAAIIAALKDIAGEK